MTALSTLADPPQVPALGPGCTVSGYVLDHLLAVGGMGTVWAARDPHGGRAAVKVMRPSIAGQPAYRARFAREVRCLESVTGPGAPRVLAADLAVPAPYLVTEYVAGPSLRDRVTDSGALPADDVVSLAGATALTLRRVHALGAVHRDVKPANLLLGPEGAVLIDFGIATTSGADPLTPDGVVMGSPGWTAPELLLGARATPASDMFGWGATVAYAATGARPFGASRGIGLAYRIEHEPPDLDAVPTELRKHVRAALSADPRMRPSAAQVVRGARTPPRHGHRWWVSGGRSASDARRVAGRRVVSASPGS